MYSAAQVRGMIEGWKSAGLKKAEIVAKAAPACMGWPYVWGALGEEDTVEKRRYYMNRSAIGPKDAELIRKRCQVLNGSAADCNGCKYHPGGFVTRIFDCRGFTRWLLQQVGISLQGAGATSQWNNAENWSEKGTIDKIPKDKVCCVFKQVGGKTMEHTGMHIGNGEIIHCSVEVKGSTVDDRSWGWTHYAIPRGLDGDAPVWRTTIRKGSTGDDVVYCQQLLMKLGWDLSPYGADGKFGNKTRDAVIAFQKTQGLVADGVVGPMSWEALEKAAGGVPGGMMYTVMIKHVDLTQAKALVAAYPNAEMKEEGE